MASWNDLLNRMSSIALGYTSGLMNPVAPVVATVMNVPKISIPQTAQYISNISNPLVSGVSSLGRISKINIPQTLQRTINIPTTSISKGLAIGVISPIAQPALSRINQISNLPRLDVTKSIYQGSQMATSSLMIPGGLAVGSAISLVSPYMRGEKFVYYEPRTNKYEPRTNKTRTSPSPTFSGLNTTNITNSTVNATALRTQDVLPTISTIQPPIYKPSGSLMSIGQNKWGSASSVGTGYYKNTRVNNQVDYGTLYTTDKGAWYLVTPRGQVIQSGGAGSLSAMPKLQLRKQKYNRTKKASKITYSKTKNKIKINKKKYRGVRK